ncbi:MAG: hypothetical protein ACOX6T_15930 [Myxococcales bacterium]
MAALLAMPGAALAEKAKAAPTPGYTEEEIVTLVRSLGKKQSIPADKLSDLVSGLRKSLETADFARHVKKYPVRGVLVFEGGEGGLLVKFMKASGLLSFKGGRQAAEVSLRTWSAGAQAGGSALWGVALVMGLNSEAHFGGDYSGKLITATAGDETTNRALLLSLKDGKGKRAHDLWVVTAGRGLSAGAGGAKMTISPRW